MANPDDIAAKYGGVSADSGVYDGSPIVISGVDASNADSIAAKYGGASVPNKGIDDVSNQVRPLYDAKFGQGAYDKMIVANQLANNPTNNMSNYQKSMAGAGKSVIDMGQGIGQIFGVNNQAAIDESKKLDLPLMNTGAGTLGYIGGNVATTMIPFGLASKGAAALGYGGAAARIASMANPTTFLGSGAMGASQGALQPVATGESRTLNAGLGTIGGVIGNGLVRGVGMIAQPIKNTLDDAGTRAVQTLRDIGVPLDAAQQSGSAFLQKIRSSFSDNPFTAGAQEKYQAGQKSAFNNAVLNTIGANSSSATPDVLSNAASNINGTFNDILSRNNIKMTDPFLSRLAQIQSGAKEEEKNGVSNVINRLLDNTNADGTIPGQLAYNVKKDFDRMASTSDSTQNYYAKQARSAVMDAINGSLSGDDQSAFQLARGQFKNLKQIEPAISNDGLGNISPSKLSNTMSQVKNRGQSLYGNGDQTLVDLAQAGKNLMPDKTGNSGSTSRFIMSQLLPVSIGTGKGVYDGINDGDWSGAAESGLSTYGGMAALPKLLQIGMNNPRVANYLANGISPGITRNVLSAPESYGLLGGSIQRVLPASEMGLLSR